MERREGKGALGAQESAGNMRQWGTHLPFWKSLQTGASGRLAEEEGA